MPLCSFYRSATSLHCPRLSDTNLETEGCSQQTGPVRHDERNPLLPPPGAWIKERLGSQDHIASVQVQDVTHQHSEEHDLPDPD